MQVSEMTAVILAGGLGTRMGEDVHLVPKPMLEVGGKPLILHIMDGYAQFGIRKFIILGGYRVEVLKNFFLNLQTQTSDFTVNTGTGEIFYLEGRSSRRRDWSVTVLDTGLRTQTGGRLLAAREHLSSLGTFFLTYGDGLSNVDFRRQLDFHSAHGRIATVCGVAPLSRFGHLKMAGDKAISFSEKPEEQEGVISGGFFVLNSEVLDYISDESVILEQGPLGRLAEIGELYVYRHRGFWLSMDTRRDREALDSFFNDGAEPWRVND